MSVFHKRIVAVFLVVLLQMAFIVPGHAENIPEPNPPVEGPNFSAEKTLDHNIQTLGTPSAEWTYHKTADGKHPSNIEQAIVWLMNNARKNPRKEGKFLAKIKDTDIAFARQYYKVNTALLKKEFAKIRKKPPAAFDVRLYNAAYEHSEDLVKRDAQDHNNQFDRVKAAGFSANGMAGNVYSYAKSALHAHAGWNIDWGPDEGGSKGGMQSKRGHRSAVMGYALDKFGSGLGITNVGIAAVPENSASTKVGPLVTTGNYAYANTSAADHFNTFIVGTVWKDKNKNKVYDPGEGLAGVTVKPNQGTYYAKTGKAGGYAIPVTNSGRYTVTFSGGQLKKKKAKTIMVGDQSVLLDIKLR